MSWREVFSTLEGFGWNYWATLLMASSVSYLGLFTILRRIVFTGVALAQVAAAGVGSAFFIADYCVGSVARFVSSYGATLGSFFLTLVAALSIRVRPSRARVGGDAFVGFIYVISAALAVLLVWRSSQGLAELREILAGEVLLTRPGELILLSVALLGVAAVHIKYRKRFLIVSYDPEFAKTLGLEVTKIDLIFLATFATAVAFSLRAGGLLLVFAFLVLPGMIGLAIGRRLAEAKLLSLSAALAGSMGGYLLAILGDLPVAHSIAVFLGGMFAFTWPLRSSPVSAALLRLVFIAGGVASVGLALSLLPSLLAHMSGSSASSADSHSGHFHGATAENSHDANHLPTAIGYLRGDGNTDQKVAAARVIGEIGERESISLLLLAFAEEEPQVKAAVVEAARVFMARRGVAHIRALAQSKDPELAAQTSRVLVALNDRLGLGYLISFLERTDAPLLLRDTVHTELQEATGRSFGYDPFADPATNATALKKWRRWREENRPE